jgi:hypothetical protein
MGSVEVKLLSLSHLHTTAGVRIFRYASVIQAAQTKVSIRDDDDDDDASIKGMTSVCPPHKYPMANVPHFI